MPINRHHAFATGISYPATTSTPPGRLRRWLDDLSLKLWRKFEQSQARAVVNSFQQQAVVQPGCRFGPNAWCVNLNTRESIQIGANTICRGLLRCERFKPASLIIGSEVYIGDDCLISCAEFIEIGSLTLLAHGVQIFDNDSHPLDALARERDWRIILGQLHEARSDIVTAPVRIGRRVWVGFNVIIMKGVSIGDNSIVAAGSVVSHNVPANVVVAGNPARIIKQFQPEEEIITEALP